MVTKAASEAGRRNYTAFLASGSGVRFQIIGGPTLAPIWRCGVPYPQKLNERIAIDLRDDDHVPHRLQAYLQAVFHIRRLLATPSRQDRRSQRPGEPPLSRRSQNPAGSRSSSFDMTAPSRSLTRFAWLAIAAAFITISLKTLAYWLTGSVGLLSDALESVVNLVAAVAALIALTVAEREPDEDHAYGHGKAEYFSSGFEGLLILIAAGTIAFAAVPRLFNPVEIESAGLGLAISSAASVVNLLVAMRLMRASEQYRSITLEADARHLMADVWTSVGVVVGIVAVIVTGWHRLDAVIALAVAANIIWTGYHLIRRSMLGLLDTTIPVDEMQVVEQILNRYRASGDVQTHALRTRQAASRRFVSVHILVPGSWSVERGHELADQIERDIREALPGTTVFTHLEPIEDERSWNDVGLDGVSSV